MEINLTTRKLTSDKAANDLVNFLSEDQEDLLLTEAELYYDFPILKDLDDDIVISKLLLVSPNHGVILFATSNATSHQNVADEINKLDAELENIFTLLYSRLIRNKALRKSKKELAFATNSMIYAPRVDDKAGIQSDSELAVNRVQLGKLLEDAQTFPVDNHIFSELTATIEGAKGLLRPRLRTIPANNLTSKGYLANGVEAEIASFDQMQKKGAMVVLDGLQRIRGLAGSGKTVVLAMKAALTHLRNPDAKILYTFHTRSLYQHIQRLITRFYRQFDDKDPDWNQLQIIHAWGGKNTAGVYYNACIQGRVQPLTYSQAIGMSANPFDYACKTLIETAQPNPDYDYVFIDEGQDFPASFIQLCIKLTLENQVVFAYDDLQTIFQAKTPSLIDIVGKDSQGHPLVELTDDIVLYKCYRNPREILVCAHALGFGFYGPEIVQMLENKEQWADIGYEVKSGKFVEGETTVIERPPGNSLTFLSNHQQPTDLVKAVVYASYEEEINGVSVGIAQNIKDGLRPDDILVIVADDINAKSYTSGIARKMLELGIGVNNVYADNYGIRDFQTEGCITLSTVHKAKGNEAFMVYVLGVDALFTPTQTVRERNLIFTAMTRAKGWVRVSGAGEGAKKCAKEIEAALTRFPNLVFSYPSPAQLKILERGLEKGAIRKQNIQRKLDELMAEMSQAEIQELIEQRIPKGEKRRSI